MFGSPISQTACFFAAVVIAIVGNIILSEVDLEPKERLMFMRIMYAVVAVLAFPGVVNVLSSAYFGAVK